MTTGNEKAMRLALEALESCTPEDTSTSHVIYAWHDEELVNKAIKALEEVLAKQSDSVEQSVSVGEPVGYFNANIDGKWEQSESNDGVPFFAALPQQRTAAVGEDTCRAWVGLTYDERVSIICEDENRSLLEHCERIEAKLKEKNTHTTGVTYEYRMAWR